MTNAVQRGTAALVSGDESERDRMTEGIELSRRILSDVEKKLDLAFAIEAPVAADLRLMITTLRVVPALERCLELARHLAERAGFADQFPADVLASFDEMGAVTTAMWCKAGTAWQNRDPAMALELDEDDDELDVLCNELTDRLGLMEDNPMVAMEGRLIVRFYERLGDHAVHISQRIPYLATGNEPTPQ